MALVQASVPRPRRDAWLDSRPLRAPRPPASPRRRHRDVSMSLRHLMTRVPLVEVAAPASRHHRTLSPPRRSRRRSPATNTPARPPMRPPAVGHPQADDTDLLGSWAHREPGLFDSPLPDLHRRLTDNLPVPYSQQAVRREGDIVDTCTTTRPSTAWHGSVAGRVFGRAPPPAAPIRCGRSRRRRPLGLAPCRPRPRPRAATAAWPKWLAPRPSYRLNQHVFAGGASSRSLLPRWLQLNPHEDNRTVDALAVLRVATRGRAPLPPAVARGHRGNVLGKRIRIQVESRTVELDCPVACEDAGLARL